MSATYNLRVFVVAALAVVITAAAAVASNGSWGAALAPAVAVAVVYGLARLPLWASASGLLAIALLFHNPAGHPMGGVWQGPLYGLGVVLFNNLRLVVNVGVLRFALLELLIVLVAAVALAQKLGPRGDLELSSATPLRWALLVSGLALTLFIAWGILRGGDFKQMLWQARQLGWTPVLAAVFLTAFRTGKTWRAVGALVVVVTLLRSLEGIYFYFAVQRPQGLDLPYLITHEDSILFVVSLVILGAMVLEYPHRKAVWVAVSLWPILSFAMVHNQRRLAYVSMAWCTVATLLLLRPVLRRAVFKIVLVLSPLLVGYVAAGWGSRAAVFAPVSALRSVDDEDNASNETRDVENFNLVHTLSKSPVVGTGFGHPYEEVRHSYSIERYMANYRFVAHNSVLALWSLAGLVGFTLIWLPLPIVIFLAVRSYGRARDATERVAALSCVGVVIAFLVQAYGDMGATGGWMGAFLLACAYAVAGNLAVATGAWPLVSTRLDNER